MTSSNEPKLEAILYPKGTKFDERNQWSFLLEQYKTFVNTAENMPVRRQAMNTLFLSINVVLLSVLGVIFKEIIKVQMALIGVIALAATGTLLCISWYKLIRSSRQLNAGKFAVIHLLEQYLPAAPFTAEWEFLGKGKDKKKYVRFTQTERIIPIVLIILYVIISVWGLISFLTFPIASA